MKRSEINEIILRSEEFIRSFQFILPPFASWTPEMQITTSPSTSCPQEP